MKSPILAAAFAVAVTWSMRAQEKVSIADKNYLRVQPNATLNQLVTLACQTDEPILVAEGQTPIGVISKRAWAMSRPLTDEAIQGR